MQVTIRRRLLTDDKRGQMCDQRCDKYFIKKDQFTTWHSKQFKSHK